MPVSRCRASPHRIIYKWRCRASPQPHVRARTGRRQDKEKRDYNSLANCHRYEYDDGLPRPRHSPHAAAPLLLRPAGPRRRSPSRSEHHQMARVRRLRRRPPRRGHGARRGQDGSGRGRGSSWPGADQGEGRGGVGQDVGHLRRAAARGRGRGGGGGRVPVEQRHAAVAAHRLPFPAAEELDERSEWSGVLPRLVPPVLPVQPGGRGVGQHRLGPRRLPRPRPLAPPPPRHASRPVVRRQRRLDRLRHRPPRRPPRHALHRLHQRLRPGPVPRPPRRPHRLAPPQLDQAPGQPRPPPAARHRRQGLPRPHHRLARPLRRHLAHRHRLQGRRPRRHRHDLQDQGFHQLRARPGAPAPRPGDRHVGVHRLVPRRHQRHRHDGGHVHVDGSKGRRGARDEGEHGRRPARLLRAGQVRRGGQHVDTHGPRGRRRHRAALRLGQVLRLQDVLRPGQAPPRALGMGRGDRRRARRRRQGLGVATVDPPDGAARHQDEEQPSSVAGGGGGDAAHQLHRPQRHHRRPRLRLPAQPPPRRAARHRGRLPARPPRPGGHQRGGRRLQLQHQRRSRRQGRARPLRAAGAGQPAPRRADGRLLLRVQGPRRPPPDPLLPRRVEVVAGQRHRQEGGREHGARAGRGDAVREDPGGPLHRGELRAGRQVDHHVARIPDGGHLLGGRGVPLQQRHRRPRHRQQAPRPRDGLLLQPSLHGRRRRLLVAKPTATGLYTYELLLS